MNKIFLFILGFLVIIPFSTALIATTGSGNDYINFYDDNLVYTNNRFYIGTQETASSALYYDGTYWYVIGTGNDRVYIYDRGFNYTGIGYNISQDGSPNGLFYNGSNWFIAGDSTAKIYVYHPNFTYTGINYSVSSQTTVIRDIYYNNTNWFLISLQGVYIYYSNWTYTGTFYNLSTQDTGMTGLTWNGSNWLTIGGTTDSIYVYYPNFTYTGITINTSVQDGSPSSIFYINNYSYTNFSIKDIFSDTTLTGVNISLYGTYNYNMITNTTNTGLIIYPGIYNLLLSKTGYTNFNDYITISAGTNSQNYYLTNNGESIIFYIKNIYDQYLTGAIVNISRANDQVLIDSKTSDGVGSATFILDPSISYLVTVTLNNYNSYSGIIQPTTSSFILTLGTNVSSPPDYYSGIVVTTTPTSGSIFSNNTNRQINTSFTSQYWNITNCYLSITLLNGTSINSTTFSTCNPGNGSGSINLFTDNYTNFKHLTTFTIYSNGTYQNVTYQQIYSITTYYEGDFSIMHAIGDIKDFNGSGFGDSERMLLVFIMIFAITITALRNSVNRYVNSGTVLILLSLLTFTASFLDLLHLDYLENAGATGPFMAQWGAAILIGILTLFTVIMNQEDNR